MNAPLTIGRFEVLRSLGKGGMAEVFLARGTGSGGFQKLVAIKRILPEMGLDEQHLQSFIDEARTCSQLTHPNIVQVFEFEQDGESHHLVMEYVEGMTLTKVLQLGQLRGTQLPLSVVAAVAAQVNDALAYAHQATTYEGRPMNIVHRDIKPANVMITTQGQVKLTDFGIAKAATNIHRTATGKGKGTLPYMAPEQFGGGRVSEATDLFAVGLLLYEMVTGAMLFETQGGLSGLLERRNEGLRPADAARVEGRAPELLPLIRRCLAEAPADRPRDAGALAAEIRALPFYEGGGALQAWMRGLTTENETLPEFDLSAVPGQATVPDEMSEAPTAPSVVPVEPTVPSTQPAVPTPSAPVPPLAGSLAASGSESASSPPLVWLPWAVAGLSTAVMVVVLVLWQPWSAPPAEEDRLGESVWLTASARPASAIHVDGKLYVNRGEVRDLELEPGTHQVRLVPVDGITPEGLFSLELEEEGDRQQWCFEYRGGAWQAQRCGP